MITEYYVLRIYRREENHKEEVLGTLEEATSGYCWSFTNDTELQQVIDEVTHPGNLQYKQHVKHD